MSTQQIGKGQVAEEALRAYFISIGYFTVRGVPFTYMGFDVTDIDLLLYIKTSPITRERINVDIKRRKTPQALERVFWTKGVQQVLGLDKCIVATTDRRNETRDFGASHDVIVLDGEFLQRLLTHFSPNPSRISEEDFIKSLDTKCVMNSDLVWRKFYRECKQILLNAQNYNGCNLLLEKVRFLIDEFLASGQHSATPLRLLYILTSYLLITLDYISRLLAYQDSQARKTELAEGFRYGEAGRKRAEEILSTAMQLVAGSQCVGPNSESQLEDEIRHQLASFPAEILAEHLSKNEIQRNLFSLARQFEAMAFMPNMVSPSSLDPPLKAVFGLLCDFYQIDRKRVI